MAPSPPAEGEKALSGLRSGTVKVLCSCDLVSEGLDVPAIGAVILLRSTKSLRLYLQQVGRGLRPAPGKDALMALDHARYSITHGLPDGPGISGRRLSADVRTSRQRPDAHRWHPAPLFAGAANNTRSPSCDYSRPIHTGKAASHQPRCLVQAVAIPHCDAHGPACPTGDLWKIKG